MLAHHVEQLFLLNIAILEPISLETSKIHRKLMFLDQRRSSGRVLQYRGSDAVSSRRWLSLHRRELHEPVMLTPHPKTSFSNFSYQLLGPPRRRSRAVWLSISAHKFNY